MQGHHPEALASVLKSTVPQVSEVTSDIANVLELLLGVRKVILNKALQRTDGDFGDSRIALHIIVTLISIWRPQ